VPVSKTAATMPITEALTGRGADNWILKYFCIQILAGLKQITVCPEKSEPPKHFALTSANMPRI